ncbi:MAG: dihydroorotate dehydrogenase-like protein [Candidatus Hydrogenedens sp.]|nr:dihydroorotate dehydrogenase-like protein [Candidatus Hydrogenedens sp.]
MLDLTTRYLGLTLSSPLVASPSPLSARIDTVRQLEDAGAAAIVLHSLFEEQITLESRDLDRHLSHGEESYGEALSYFPELDDYKLGPDSYLEHIRACKEAVSVPVIASLNGVSAGGWTRYAKLMQEAGADALELNEYYIPTDPDESGADVEAMYEELVREVCAAVTIPVAVKLAPFFSSTANMCKRLAAAGAKGLVLFNRFYQPDFDLEQLAVLPNLVLSDSNELRLRLRWAAILHGRVDADLAITGGVHSGQDAVKCLMAGANVAMMTSALLRNGISHLATVRGELIEWMEEHDYTSVEMMQGAMSQRSCAEPAAYERANYIHVLGSYTAR